MTTLGRLSLLGMLLGATACSGQAARPAARNVRQDRMISVVTTATIAGAPEAVFDLITTARFWPQWHPASMAVAGVTERPYGLGDRIYERGRIGRLNFQVVWKVVEHVRPSRAVLQAEASPTRITYAFQAQNGGTLFTRTLEYRQERPSLGTSDPDEMDRLMQVQSEQAATQLKAMVEGILRAEAIPIQ